MAGIYIHIPYCRQACSYCDFHFSTSLASKDALLAAIAKEAEAQKHYFGGEPITSIYFGGGTPSMLQDTEIAKLLQAITTHFTLASNPEITLEVNPDDVKDQSTLLNWQAIGINRLSIGVQSFDTEILTFFNRAHTSDAAKNVLSWAVNIGFGSVSADLIYAAPGFSADRHYKDATLLTSYGIDHIAVYTLTLEPKTLLGNMLNKGKITPVPDDEAATQHLEITSIITKANYQQYEVSSFCLNNKYSRHNSSYWRQQPYLGLGPSAHSFNGSTRHINIANNAAYINAINAKTPKRETEILTTENKVNEILLTGLRTKWGADLGQISTHLGYDFAKKNSLIFNQLIKDNLGSIDDLNHLKLSKTGLLLADGIAASLFVG